MNNVSMAQWAVKPLAMAKDAQRVSFEFVEQPVVKILEPGSLED